MPWIQYYISGSPIDISTNSQKVSDSDLAALGKAQIFYDGDPSGMMVDITQNPPAVVQAPPPPPPPADMLTHVFNALVQQGWIDASTVDPDLLNRANASLAATGAPTISAMAKIAPVS